MLQNIREGIQGPWAIGIVALIVISFVFTGVGSYISSSNSSAVAIVNGEEIEANSLEIAYNNERARLENQYGEAVSSLFSSESYVTQFRNDILERLIDDELVSQKAEDLGLRVSDQQVKNAISQMAEFKVAGAFDNDVYLSTLARAGYTPSKFAEYIREQMTRQQLAQAITSSSFSLDYQVQSVLALQGQTRSAQTLEIDLAKYQDSIELSDEEIQLYYQQNLANFDTQEQVKLAYITLSVSDLALDVDVNPTDAENYYNENKDLYTSEEVRRVSHILFENSEDETAARKRAEDVLQELQNGADFAVLAEQNSDDIISAESGGDLNTISREDYTGAFGDAAFALQQAGDTSDIVESEFGLHIIKLTELTPAVVTPFEEVKADIESEIRTDKATDEYFSLQQEMARLAFEEPNSLEAVSQATGRPIIESAFFEKGRLPPGLNYPQLDDVSFSSELIDEQVNSELLELGNDTVMVVRVAEHKPQRTRSLDEVKAQIESSLKVEKAQEQALAYAQEIQSAMFNGDDLTELLAQQSLSWSTKIGLARNSNELPAAMLESIFSLSTESGNDSAVVPVAGGNVGIVKLTDVTESTSTVESDIATAKQRLQGMSAQQTYQNFVEDLRRQAEIEIVNL